MKWAIVKIETDELIEIYEGSFMEVMGYANRNYDDGDIDIVELEIYQTEW